MNTKLTGRQHCLVSSSPLLASKWQRLPGCWSGPQPTAVYISTHVSQFAKARHESPARTDTQLAATAKGDAPTSTLREFGFAKDFAERYDLGRAIGSGSFGTVHIATDRATGQEVAVKVITKRILGGYLDPVFVRRVQHEVDIYSHVGHSLNVAYLYGAYENAVHVKLVMELCKGGELWTRVQRGKYCEGAAAALVAEILRTLAQCHAKGIVLRDVKPENFLFLTPAPDAPLKMIDFGLATYCRPGQVLSDRAGSPLYVAPEVLKQSYGQKCDVWSAGVIAYQLLTGRFPFEDEDQGLLLSSLDVLGNGNGDAGDSGTGKPKKKAKNFTNKEVFFAILYGDLDFVRPPWNEISSLAREFVSTLLQRDPNVRPTAAEALQHPWIRQNDPASASSASSLSSCTASLSSMEDISVDNLVSMDVANGPTGLASAIARDVIRGAGSSSSSSSSKAAGGNGSCGCNGRGHKSSSGGNGSSSGSRTGSRSLSDSLVQRLQRYGTYGRLKQLALRAMVGLLAASEPERLSALSAAFRQQLHPPESPGLPGAEGRLPYGAVRDMLLREWDLSPTEAMQLLAAFDVDARGCVDRLEWLAALVDWREVQQSPRWPSYVDRVFDLFDVSHSGSLTRNNLQRLLCSGSLDHNPDSGDGADLDSGSGSDLEECPFDDVVPAALREADSDADGAISRQEFGEFLSAGAAGDLLEFYESRRRRRRSQQEEGGQQGQEEEGRGGEE
ncbi:hypothetical protein Agub_g4417 [Astrephomene gubernaculifera]|uniref:Uncharacterized protein n=1 Tax=Astrephomene gubernaculifera TaxID=47775 RepID=A0AAD3DMY2_9CHLO|nr:hypothetical protein Agub_g4417 [Astrephomene gubernaculifera]